MPPDERNRQGSPELFLSGSAHFTSSQEERIRKIAGKTFEFYAKPWAFVRQLFAGLLGSAVILISVFQIIGGILTYPSQNLKTEIINSVIASTKAQTEDAERSIRDSVDEAKRNIETVKIDTETKLREAQKALQNLENARNQAKARLDDIFTRLTQLEEKLISEQRKTTVTRSEAAEIIEWFRRLNYNIGLAKEIERWVQHQEKLVAEISDNWRKDSLFMSSIWSHLLPGEAIVGVGSEGCIPPLAEVGRLRLEDFSKLTKAALQANKIALRHAAAGEVPTTICPHGEDRSECVEGHQDEIKQLLDFYNNVIPIMSQQNKLDIPEAHILFCRPESVVRR